MRFVVSILALAGLLLGLFVATRKSEAENAIDISGTWEIVLHGATLDGSCTLGITQRDDAVLFAGRCSIIWPVVLTGSIDQTTGEFSVRDEFGIASAGRANKDSSSMSGTWGGFGFNGVFTGNRVNTTADFVDGTGHWQFQLGPAEAPLGDFSDNCTAVIRQAVSLLFASLDCEQLGQHVLGGGIDPFSGDFFLSPPTTSDDGLSQIQGVISDSGTISGSFTIDAPEEIHGSIAGVRIGGQLGDVDCNEVRNSIDATLLLQWSAGLLPSLPCPDFADITGDQMANSLDSILLLQFSAGLILNLALHF